MQTIHKFQLPVDDHVSVEMPYGSHILHVAEQHGGICLWAQVETEAPTVTRRFRIAGTGHPLGNDAAGNYCGTAHLANGALVFHVFEI